jgi:hypothetical protein
VGIAKLDGRNRGGENDDEEWKVSERKILEETCVYLF